MEGYVAATNNLMTRLYFMMFYMASVLVVMNVCTAFLIDAFTVCNDRVVQVLEMKKAMRNEQGEAALKKAQLGEITINGEERSSSSRPISMMMQRSQVNDPKSRSLVCALRGQLVSSGATVPMFAFHIFRAPHPLTEFLCIDKPVHTLRGSLEATTSQGKKFGHSRR